MIAHARSILITFNLGNNYDNSRSRFRNDEDWNSKNMEVDDKRAYSSTLKRSATLIYETGLYYRLCDAGPTSRRHLATASRLALPLPSDCFSFALRQEIAAATGLRLRHLRS